MHYYVDGYNYLFRNAVPGEELQTLREALIVDLNYKSELLNLTITIVFDAHYQEGDSTITHYQHVKIIYTAERESADSYIIKTLKHVDYPKAYTLVTSDNKLAWQARTQLIKTMSVEDFSLLLNKKSRCKTEKLEKAPQVLETEAGYNYYEKIFMDKLQETTGDTSGIVFKEQASLTPEILKREEEEEEKDVKKGEKRDETDQDRWLRIFEGENGA